MDLFYLAGVIFIIESIRQSIMAKKELHIYKMDISALPQNKNVMVGAFIGLVAMLWNIAGLFTDYSFLFAINLFLTVGTGIMIGMNEKLRTVFVIAGTNILSIVMMASRLYFHFK